MLITRWYTTKPQGMAGTGAGACAGLDMSTGHTGRMGQKPFGSYGTHVSNRTIGRPKGRGGSAG